MITVQEHAPFADPAGPAGAATGEIVGVAGSPARTVRSARSGLAAGEVLLDVRAGDRVLDVGCGTGEGVRSLARLVGESGRVVGLDGSVAAVAEARRRSVGLGPAVEYQVGDPHDLPFGDGVFDGCRAEGLLQQLDDPGRALREMIRVGRRGAQVVVAEGDWATLSVEAVDERITGRLREFLGGRGCGEPAARRFAELFRACGLGEVTITPTVLRETGLWLTADPLGLRDALERAQTAGAVSAVEAATWLDEVEWASRRGRFAGSLVWVRVAGRRGAARPGHRHRYVRHGARRAGVYWPA